MIQRTVYDDELARLRHDLLTMGALVEDNIRKALEALRSSNVELAKEVKRDDKAVNAMQTELGDRVAMLIATQQPVARELRELVAILKAADELERIGDYAAHLAKAAKRLAEDPYPRSLERIEAMAAEGSAMLHDAMAAFLAGDQDKARAVAARDDAIDKERKAFIKEVLLYIQEHPDRAEQATRLVATAGVLERLGDHVTNLCEAAVYVATGEHVDLND
ncbi:MAG: phosphate signaling complex protein PhoU [Spirochaetales bacterium]|nr:phosphate signaling complex protein PhoU [Spirochaetales bacterium]